MNRLLALALAVALTVPPTAAWARSGHHHHGVHPRVVPFFVGPFYPFSFYHCPGCYAPPYGGPCVDPPEPDPAPPARSPSRGEAPLVTPTTPTRQWLSVQPQPQTSPARVQNLGPQSRSAPAPTSPPPTAPPSLVPPGHGTYAPRTGTNFGNTP